MESIFVLISISIGAICGILCGLLVASRILKKRCPDFYDTVITRYSKKKRHEAKTTHAVPVRVETDGDTDEYFKIVQDAEIRRELNFEDYSCDSDEE